MRIGRRRAVQGLAAAAAVGVTGRWPAAPAGAAGEAAGSWRIAWRLALNDPWQAPALLPGDRVLLIERNALVAAEAGSGAIAWRHALEVMPALGCACQGAPAVAPEAQRVFCVSAGNEIQALDASTGGVVWRQRAGDLVITAPVPAHDRVLVLAADGDDMVLLALDAATGGLRWRSVESRRLLPDPVWDPAAEVVYVLDAPGRLRALDATTGEVRWDLPGEPPDGGAAQAGLAPAQLVAQGLAVIRERGLEVVEQATGAVRWRYTPDGGWLSWATHIPDAGIVLAGGLVATVAALDAQIGTPRWTVPVSGGAFLPAAVAGGIAAIASAGELIAVRLADGAERWRQPAGALPGSPVISRDATWVASAMADHVRAWELAGGAPLADAALDGGVLDPPAVDGQRLYVQTLPRRAGAGFAYALEPG